MPWKLDSDGIVKFQRMRVYVPGQANFNPPKRIKRLQELIDTHAPNVCVVRGEGIGDVLMTTPLLHGLKEMFDDNVHVTYATNTRYLGGALARVLKHNPDIDRIIDREEIDESDYDIVINLHCPAIGYERNLNNPPKNRVDIFAEHAGVSLTDKKVKYFIQPEEIEAGDNFISKHGVKIADKVILVHLFTSAVRRNLDTMVMKDTLQQLANVGFKLILLRHRSDPPSNIMWESIPGVVVLKDADIRHVAGVMKNCDLLLCPDSIMLHIAGALNVPTIALFGDTNPKARTNYYSSVSYIWPGEGIKCCPCWLLDCTMNYTCFKMISSRLIVDACLQKLQGQLPQSDNDKEKPNQQVLADLV